MAIKLRSLVNPEIAAKVRQVAKHRACCACLLNVRKSLETSTKCIIASNASQCQCVCVYLHIFTYTHICICVRYIYIYIHIHIRIYTSQDD